MKLLDQFKQQVAEIGELKRVWLTTFNLDIAFVETWILPAVLKMDVPVGRMDYEGLQQALNASGIDFRIFCDPRMIAKEKPKRTSITVCPVSPRSMALSEETNINTDSGLFHPKVFYLEGKNKKRVIGAGSANLTLSGWGRNQEVVDFRTIASNTQYQQVRRFFTAIDRDLDALLQKRIPNGEESDWSFIHSLAGKTLLEALKDGHELETLSVWSPYLADDLAAFIGKLGDDLHVKLVPDRIGGGHIRTRWSEDLQARLDNGTLTLYHSPAAKDERALMTHAKIWLAKNTKNDHRLAIGSWNFTSPGCSSLADKKWNVEAGIVHRVTKKVSICGEPWSEVDESDFASDEELAEESLKPGELPPFDLTVVFDWSRGEYQVTGKWHHSTPPQAGYQLILPGITMPCELVWNRRGQGLAKMPPLVCQKSQALLDNPFYTLRKAGVADWLGLINETDAEFRRTLSFASLDDLLNSYLHDANPADSDRLLLRSAVGQDEAQAEGEQADAQEAPEAISYFRLFQATQQRRNRLEAMKKGSDLHRCLFSDPGCLLELAEMTRQRTEQTPDSVFNWFLAQEVNCLAKLARRRARKIDEPLSLSSHQWASLTVTTPDVTGDSKSQYYLAAIREKCGYGK